ncbi:MAG: NADH-quinone oxidoreductase subunit L [Phycisphaerae bacterium]
MNESTMLWLILVPLVGGVLTLLTLGPLKKATGALALAAATLNLGLAVVSFGFKGAWSMPLGSSGIELALRYYNFTSFIIAAVAGFGFLVTLYSLAFMKDRPWVNQFYCYLLLSVGLTNGAVLADNLVAMLFFWEGLLGPLFGMIAIGRPGAYKTATKAFIIVGVTDVCMMAGIALTGYLAAKTPEAAGNYLSMQAISRAGLTTASGIGGLAFVLLMIGAISKAGSMPFHSWIPDAAVDSPLPFMAILPASLEKLLGIYFLARITLDLYHLTASWASWLLMIIGALTILLAVMMALVQKDYKRLLSYHAISQVGYMVLGVGTAIPVGIVGGIFHMINHAMYKSCLFLTGGSVEKQTGTTDLAKLGGIGRKMPVTFACFIIAAAAISGFPLTNGFYSKELVYQGSLEAFRTVPVFYIAALLGTFLTAASFLKLGHSAYLGRRDVSNDNVKEAPLRMLVPMIVIAGGCMLFGLYNALPLQNLVEPVVKDALGAGAWATQVHGGTFAGLEPHQWLLAILTCVAIGGAFINHWYGASLHGGGLHAVDHIQNAPVLATIYDKAAKRAFDPYDLGLKGVYAVAAVLNWVDRTIDWIYDRAATTAGYALSLSVRTAHTGNYATYVAWCLLGAAAVIIFLVGWL